MLGFKGSFSILERKYFRIKKSGRQSLLLLILIGPIKIFFITNTRDAKVISVIVSFLEKYKPTIKEINLAKKLSIPLSRVIEKDNDFINKSSKNNRTNLLNAKKIFDELGWVVKDEILYDDTNTRVEFDFLLAQKGFERILAPFAKNLKKARYKAKL